MGPAFAQDVHRPVGRDRELGLLQQSLSRLLHGESGFVLIGGEAGIGKTTLVRWLAGQARQRGVIVLTGHCYELESTPPYGPWQELARDAPGDLFRELARANPVDLAHPLLTAGSHDLRAAVQDELANVASESPVLLVLEDMHWADRESLELTRYLTRTIGAQPLLLVMTYRDAELHPAQPLYQTLPYLVREGGPLRIAVRPLDRTAVATLIAHRFALPERDITRLTDHLQRHAEGNPFFIEELLIAFEDDRVIEQAPDGDWRLGDLREWTVPPLVRQTIEARLAQLPHSVQRSLEVAAVIGSDVPLDLWEQVIDEPGTLNATMQEALAERFLEEIGHPGSLRFRHALLRQALYERLPLPRRQRLHRRIGELLASEAEPDIDAVADHLWRGQTRAAIPWLIRAGDRALALQAPGIAIDRYDQAFELAATHDEEVLPETLLARGRAYEVEGRFDAAQADFLAALDRARTKQPPSVVEQWQALIELGSLWSAKDYERAGTFFQQALQLSSQLDDRHVRARSLSWMSNWYLNVGQLDRVFALQDEALAMLESLGDLTGIADAATMLAVTYLIQGDCQMAMTCAWRAAGLMRGKDERRHRIAAFNPLIAVAGSYEFATEIPALLPPSVDIRAIGEEAIQLSQATGWPAGEAFARMAFGSHLGYQGAYAEALMHEDQAWQIAEDIEHTQWMALSCMVRGHLSLDLFSLDEALAHAERAAALTHETRSFVHTHLSAALLARIHVARGEPNLAREALAPFLIVPEGSGSAVERGCWAAWTELALAEGDVAGALEAIERLIATTRNRAPGKDSPHLLALRARALWQAGHLDEASRTADEAIRLANQWGFVPLEWRLHALAGDLTEALKRTDAAASHRQTAQGMVDAIAASLPDPVRGETFRAGAAGLLRQTAHPAQRDASSLSPRELEVLRLAAQGMTNGEIAERLYVSSRTVKGHLQSIYNKLGVNTRTAATALAYERGWVTGRTNK